MKKDIKGVVFGVLFFLLQFQLVQTEEILLRIPRKNTEPASLNPIFMFDIPENFINGKFRPETVYYSKSVKEFKKSLTIILDSKGYEHLIGKWKTKEPRTKEILSMERYGIVNDIEFLMDNEYGNLIAQMPESVDILRSREGDIYFTTYWLGVLMKIVYLDEKIYIYHLVGDWWEIDAVHNGGKSPFIKISK